MHVVRRIASFLLTGAIACALLSACGGSSNTTIPSVTPPVVQFNYVATGLSVVFNGVATNVAAGYTPTYTWSFGDGSTGTATAQTTHVYAAAGTYTVTLTVLAGSSASRVEQVVVSGGTPVSLENWAFVSGNRYANSFGVYQTEFTPSSANLPGGRLGAVTWTDAKGRVWLFGGSGYDSNGTAGALNDLWRFDPALNSATDTAGGQWTWVNGSNVANATGVYGTLNSVSVGSIIGARSSAAHWTDSSGNFWLFGGFGYDSTGTLGLLNDMWMISSVTGSPVWVGGANTVNIAATPGTQGQAAAGNVPQARAYATTWTDHQGNFWLFGGQAVNSSGVVVTCNDLWMFNPTTKLWTWVSGQTSGNNTGGVYGTQGTGSTANLPGARLGAVGWTDTSGNLWLFGGTGYDVTDTGGVLNDMWKFNPTSGQWTWVTGSSAAGAAGVYGTIGVAAATYTPSSRAGAVGWTDPKTGRLWLFGGGGYDSTGVSTTSDGGGDLNDLWSFNPATQQWAWMGGPSVAGGAGVYSSTEGNNPFSFSTLNTPGARMWSTAWVDSTGNFWLFGGSGVDDELLNGDLNDLWTMQVIVPAP